MTIGSLFSGIGGLELGLEWAGLGPVAWQVEADAWCRGVLARHWPGADRSVHRVQDAGRANLALVDIICGGFPCQDVSVAGKGAGLDGARSGLWREFARIIGELRPRVVVIENVSQLITRGLDRVAADLAGHGYSAHARILRASDVGAPHRRERLFVVAVAHSDRGGRQGERIAQPGRIGSTPGNEPDGCDRPRGIDGQAGVADTHGGTLRQPEQRLPRGRPDGVCDQGIAQSGDDGSTRGRTPQSGLGGDPNGIPSRVDRFPSGPGDAAAVWEPPRSVDAWSPVWGQRLTALGNAVVPQCAAVVGEYVKEMIGC